MALSASQGTKYYTHDDYLFFADETTKTLAKALSLITPANSEEERRLSNEYQKLQLLEIFKSIVLARGEFKTNEKPSVCFKRHSRVVSPQVTEAASVKKRKKTSLLKTTLIRNSPVNQALAIPSSAGSATLIPPPKLTFRSDQFRKFLEEAIQNSNRPEVPQRDLSERDVQPIEQDIRVSEVVFLILGIIIVGAHIYEFIRSLLLWF